MTSYEMSGGAPGSQPWYLRTQLEREYIVQDIPMSTAKIDSNIDTLLVIHPAGIADDGQFAIDQYLLGGGRVIAMLDPFSLFNRQAAARPQQIPGMPPPNAARDLDVEQTARCLGRPVRERQHRRRPALHQQTPSEPGVLGHPGEGDQ